VNILLLAPDFFPVWGGAGTYVTELARHLPEDVNLHIVALRRQEFRGDVGGKEMKQAEGMFPKNVTIHYIGDASDTFAYNISYQISIIRKIKKLIIDLEIDLVHTHSSMPDLFYPAQKMGVPVLTTIHNSSEMQIAGWKRSGSKFKNLELSEKMIVLGRPLFKSAEKIYYSQPRHYMAVSGWTKDQFTELYSIDRKDVDVVYNGVDHHKYSPERRDQGVIDRMDPEPKGPRILFMARMLELKGISTLIEAIPLVLKSCDASFIFAGPGNPGRVKSLPKETRYLGYIDHDETPAYVAGADIYVLPSFSETFPFSLLEAMASQTAVVSTTAGGIPEMIENGRDGVLIEAGDVQGLAASLKELVENDSKRKQYALNARQRAVRDFTWDRTAAAVLDVYTSCIGGK
jgi:glycosyltransferase involved in cell wall biosynthesis